MGKHRFRVGVDREPGIGMMVGMANDNVMASLERQDVLPRPMLTWIEFNHCWHSEEQKGSGCEEDPFDKEPAFWDTVELIGAPSVWKVGFGHGPGLGDEEKVWSVLDMEAQRRGIELKLVEDVGQGLLPPTQAIQLRGLAAGKGEAARKTIAKKASAARKAPGRSQAG